MNEPGIRVYQVTFTAKLVVLGSPADWTINVYQLVGEEEGIDGAVVRARTKLPGAVRWTLRKAAWVAKTVDPDGVEEGLYGGETYGEGV